jgi:hypothetical protein
VFSAYALFKILLFKLEHSQLTPNMDTKDPEVLKQLWSSWSHRLDIFLVFLLLAFFLFDIVFVAIAALFTLLSLTMFLHRVLWPILSRMLYASQRFKIISHGLVLIYSGVALILLGIGKFEWIKAFLK